MQDIGGFEMDYQKDLDLVDFWGKFQSHIRTELAFTLSKEH